MTRLHTTTAAPLGLQRRLTAPGVTALGAVEWELRDARIMNHRDGTASFEQPDVEFPRGWSLNASNIVAQKYFRGILGTETRERSLRQVVDRVVDTITSWGAADGVFADDEERETFREELKAILYTQRAAFNSPVWFNLGVPGVPAQGSACFILSVDDSMDSILNWYREEGIIFKGGSAPASTCRGSGVPTSRSREAAPPRAPSASCAAPTRPQAPSSRVARRGAPRRWSSSTSTIPTSRTSSRARSARSARHECCATPGSTWTSTAPTQCRSSTRTPTTRFACPTSSWLRSSADAEWPLIARGDGSVVRSVSARALMRSVAEAAWECGDPGVQYDTTINRWNTAANTGPINASNPCSEYMHLDNSACNLASLNLLTFLDESGVFDVEDFRHVVEIVLVAQEIIVGHADYPTPEIGANTRRFRQLGMGYTNLGALLMALGYPYDSDGGRAWAAAITSLMTGHAYLTSARLAARLGPFDGFADNRAPMLRVLGLHRQAAHDLRIDPVQRDLAADAVAVWDAVADLAAECGVRNAQASVLAPTGTISFMMDADTTGIEPDLGLVKTKKLVGGGTMSIVNQTVERALRRLGYDEGQIADISGYINTNHSVLGAPHISADHVAIFACSMGDNIVSPRGHLEMMAAVQPFLSGAISKTVNTPETTTVDEIEQIYIDGWRLGLKAVAIYRDNCKVGQPLSTGTGTGTTAAAGVAAGGAGSAGAAVAPAAVPEPVRERLPRARNSRTFEFRVADCKGFATVGEYADGRPGELFVRVSKQGSTLAGIMDAFAIAVSHGLQYGVPIEAYVRAFVGMRFEPAGMTDDPDLRLANVADGLPVPAARARLPAGRPTGRARHLQRVGTGPAHTPRRGRGRNAHGAGRRSRP
jgi:ribonucleoside-diphosphate reductase alpha chain